MLESGQNGAVLAQLVVSTVCKPQQTFLMHTDVKGGFMMLNEILLARKKLRAGANQISCQFHSLFSFFQADDIMKKVNSQSRVRIFYHDQLLSTTQSPLDIWTRTNTNNQKNSSSDQCCPHKLRWSILNYFVSFKLRAITAINSLTSFVCLAVDKLWRKASQILNFNFGTNHCDT